MPVQRTPPRTRSRAREENTDRQSPQVQADIEATEPSLPTEISNIKATEPSLPAGLLIAPLQAKLSDSFYPETEPTPASMSGKPQMTLEDVAVITRDLMKKHDTVKNFTEDIEPLKLDGSNMIRWKLRTATAIFDMTGVANYWSCDGLDVDQRVEPLIDKCAGRVVYVTIHEDLKDLIGGIADARDRMAKLTGHFRHGGRTAQYAIFKGMVARKFDPGTTDLLTHINEIHKDMDRLENEGFRFTKDGTRGMFYQLGAPVSGNFGMDSVNNSLDNQYQMTGTPCTSEDVCAAMQNMITNRKTVNETESAFEALAVSRKTTTSLGQKRAYQPQSSEPSYFRRSSQAATQGTRRAPPGPISVDNSERKRSFENPLRVPPSAHQKVHLGVNQCYHCGVFGHFFANCPDKAKGLPRKALHWNDWRRLKNGRAYSIDVLYLAGNHAATAEAVELPASVEAAAVGLMAEGSDSDGYACDLLLDGGATHTVTNDKKHLFDFRQLSSPIPLTTAAKGQRAEITGVGKLRLMTRGGADATIDKVYFSDQVNGTLVSRGALIESGARFHFVGSDIVVRLPGGQEVLALYRNRRWWLNVSNASRVGLIKPCANAVKPGPVQARLWHARFGHVDMKRIRKLFAKGMALGIPKKLPGGDFVCESCLICKSTRTRTLGRTGREAGLLDIVVSDVLGPMSPDLHGARYVVMFRDVASTFSEAVILQQKSEVTVNFIRIITRWERETGFVVKAVRSDGGGEYMKNQFADWLKQKGITHEHSNPYEPEQNGVAERLNRTIGDMARTLLKDSTLPTSFWSYAYLCAVYLHNRLPNSLSGDKTPYELFHGRKPQLDILRTFGTVAFAHIHQPQRHSKLDDRGVKCRMVGYIPGGKGWRFYDEEKNFFFNSAMARYPYEEGVDERREEADENVDGGNKASLDFILNELRLGEFAVEEGLEEQDRMAERLTGGVDLMAGLVAPTSYQEAMKADDADRWKMAMGEELEMMNEMSVWRVVDKPELVRPLSLKWVFTYKKLDDDGRPERYKARLVARGFTQVEGVDYGETFAPTATFASLRFLLAYAAKAKLPMHSFDVTAAYLHSDLKEKLYFKLPPGHFAKERKEGKVLEAMKALYGTKQGANCWWQHFEKILKSQGFVASVYDQSLYVCRRGDDFVVIWAHVDDGAVMGSSEGVLEEIAERLVEVLKIRWSKTLDCIVGITVERLEDGSFELSQPGLTAKVVEKFGGTYGGASTPMDQKIVLTTAEEGETKHDPTEYLSAIGTLNYLSVATRPDLTYAVNFLARFSADPSEKHWGGVMRVVQYLKSVGCLVLHVKPDDGEVSGGLSTFVDANWGGEASRSTHGFISTFLGCPVAWTSKRQGCVASSTCHAEFMGLGMAAREAVWLRRLVEDVLGAIGPVNMFCDNTSAIHISKCNSANKKTRHADREFFYVNEQIYRGNIVLHWVASKEQLEDIFTKPLGPKLLNDAKKRLCLK